MKSAVDESEQTLGNLPKLQADRDSFVVSGASVITLEFCESHMAAYGALPHGHWLLLHSRVSAAPLLNCRDPPFVSQHAHMLIIVW